MGKSILDYNTVELNKEEGCIIIIDQTLLPGKTELIKLKTAQEIWDAIYLLKVRGAPAIGVAAGFGMYVLSTQNEGKNIEEFVSIFKKDKEYLNSSRPTAVNLSWALNRMEKKLISVIAGIEKQSDSAINGNEEEYKQGVALADTDANKDEISFEKCREIILEALYEEAMDIQKEDIDTCRKLGEYGLSLVKPGDGILTHCNAGQLATSKYGTATAPIYLGQEKGYNFRVFADETRPLLQGARLTAYELSSAGVDVTLICDNMSAMVMRNGWVDAVFVGCDRVAANGDVANKIGTSVVATVAKRFNVPFYVCAPTSTIDMNTKTGNDIKIEERPAHEVTDMWYEKPMAPKDIKVFNPAFDVTDNEYITAIITEKGIARAPYTESLKEICG